MEQSPAAKSVLAIAIFRLIVGGWIGFQHYRHASVALPGPQRAGQATG
jgi:hypothetical protein